jgi:hypothetical protein
MRSLIEKELGKDSYACVTPTGFSAVNINGCTLHSKFRIQSGEFYPLKGNCLHELCEEISNMKFLILDEYSMIGCEKLYQIDERLKQAKGSNEDFGGMFVYMFGDCYQLPPVGDSAPYSDNISSLERLKGKTLYHSFDGAVILEQVQRQRDPTFKQVLEHIAQGKVTNNDYNILKSRFVTSVSISERKKFDDAVRFYPINELVDECNYQKLGELKDAKLETFVPIVQIKGLHNCRAAKDSSTNQAQGVPALLTLSRGAQIMLKMNLWTKQGLVNGALGSIVDILYDTESVPGEDLPAVLICKFDKYKGPYIDNDLQTVSIIPVTKSWNLADGTKCTRTNFPIALSYSCTIHKSQGMTLKMVKRQQQNLIFSRLM